MLGEELYELSRQDPELGPGVETNIMRRRLIFTQPAQLHWVLVVCLLHYSGCLPLLGHREGAGVSVSLLDTPEMIAHKLPVLRFMIFCTGKALQRFLI